jgi:hypothetical protein
MALRGRLQKGTLVAWQENGMACVNQTRPHYVNQMGKTQSNDLAERHGMCESALKNPPTFSNFTRLFPVVAFMFTALILRNQNQSNFCLQYSKLRFDDSVIDI